MSCIGAGLLLLGGVELYRLAARGWKRQRGRPSAAPAYLRSSDQHQRPCGIPGHAAHIQTARQTMFVKNEDKQPEFP